MIHGDRPPAADPLYSLPELRFGFGANWQRFSQQLSESQIVAAERSLQRLLGLDALAGKNFVDVGSGSGLFSLAAWRLGASVFSFDYDADSVACTSALRERAGALNGGGRRWEVFQGSALDSKFLESVPQADVLYSWGVLHHTGDMWSAFDLVERLVKPDGLLCIAIYNDQGVVSTAWKQVKRIYNTLPAFLQLPYLLAFGALSATTKCFSTLLQGKNPFALSPDRGMSWWFDHVDWIGGYPFEVAKPEAVFRFFRDRGFTLRELTTQRGNHGCCEYLFRKAAR